MPSFEEWLAAANEQYANSESFDNWMPPIGKYLAVVDKVRTGVKDAAGWISVGAKLLSVLEAPVPVEGDPPLEGRKFSLGYFNSKSLGMLKSLVKRLCGKEVNDLPTAAAIVINAQGTVVEVTVKASKDGQYINAYVDKVVDSAPAEEAPPEDAPAE